MGGSCDSDLAPVVGSAPELNGEREMKLDCTLPEANLHGHGTMKAAPQERTLENWCSLCKRWMKPKEGGLDEIHRDIGRNPENRG